MTEDTPPLRITWLQADLIAQAMMERTSPEGVRQELSAHGIEVTES